MQIGAIPSLSSGDEPFIETQVWARAIYQDTPADRSVSGVHYSGAHEEGECLALWDTGPRIELVVAAGQVADRPLLDPGILTRFQQAMVELGMPVRPIRRDECRPCLAHGGF